MKWQKIKDGDELWTTERAAVPGGWLVRFWSLDRHHQASGMVFVPDARHTWDPDDDMTMMASAAG